MIIDNFLKVVSTLVLAIPSDDHFHKVWIIFLNRLKDVQIIRDEMKRRFEIYVVKIDWIINIEFLLNWESCNRGVLPLLQLDEFQ